MYEEEKLEAKCFHTRVLREIRRSVNVLERDCHSQNPFGRKKAFVLKLLHISLS